MSLVNLGRVFKFGLLGFYRNRWLSLVATAVLALTLFTISMFAILTFAINVTTFRLKEKVDLSVYLTDEAKDEEVTNLKNTLSTLPIVKNVESISKEEALKIWQKRMEKKPKLKEVVTSEENPLPRSLEVKVTDPGQMETLVKFLEQDKYKGIIRKLSYQENKVVIERLLDLTKLLRKIGLTLSIIFIIVSILVVLNTIRLAIYNRGDEIEIERLVGATYWFIQTPFILEAFLYGFFAAIFSTLFLYYTLRYFAYNILSTFPSLTSLSVAGPELLSFFSENLYTILFLQMLLGIFLSISCSLISLRRHLKI